MLIEYLYPVAVVGLVVSGTILGVVAWLFGQYLWYDFADWCGNRVSGFGWWCVDRLMGVDASDGAGEDECD